MDTKASVAIIGCGFIGESYLANREQHPGLDFRGLYDRDSARSRILGEAFGLTTFASQEDLLSSDAELVLNLTNPREHAEVTRACLEAGKHVYSEKPLGMTTEEARPLVELARQKGLQLGTAPCSVLSPCAQVLWKAVCSGLAGRIRLVYANFDDGMIAPHEQPWSWRNGLGVPWPARDEFEVGCTYEHAGYFLTWLCSFFGPVKRMTGFASTQVEDKGIPVDSMAPDFTVGCLEFREGVVARVTCGLVAPKDKSLLLVGDAGILSVENLRDDYGAVWFEPRHLPRRSLRMQAALRRLQRLLPAFVPKRLSRPVRFTGRRRLPMPGPLPPLPTGGDKRADFLRGPAELAAAIRENRPCRLSGELGLHITEIIEQLQYPETRGVRMKTDCPETAPPKGDI